MVKNIRGTKLSRLVVKENETAKVLYNKDLNYVYNDNVHDVIAM